MRAPISKINFASAGIRLVFGRERKSRFLSSHNLELLYTAGSSSEEELYVGKDNPMSKDDQYLIQNVNHDCDEFLSVEEQSRKPSFSSNEETDKRRLENSQNDDQLRRMKGVLESCGWILGSPETCGRITSSEYNVGKILNDLFGKGGDAALALAFFRWLECHTGSENTVRSTCVMIHILVAGNFNYGAIDLIRRLVRKNGDEHWANFLLKVIFQTYTCRKVLLTVSSMLVDCYVRENLAKVALTLAHQMKYLNLFPSIRVCNSLLGALIRSEQMELALNFLEEMGSQKIVLNAFTLSLFINDCCVRGKLDTGWKLLMRMQKLGIRPDIVTYTSFINSLCKMSLLKEAVSLIFKMTWNGILPDSVSVSSVTDGLCKVGEMEKAINILDIFNLPPNIYVYNSFISKFCAGGNMTAASNTFHEMLEFGFVADCFLYTTMMSGYCKAGEINMAHCFFAKMMKIGIRPSVTTYTTLIDYHCKSGELDEAEHIFQKMIKDGLGPDLVLYNTLIYGYGKKGHLHKVFGLLDMIKSAGLSPANTTYNILIHSLTVRGLVTEANELLNELIRRGYSPDIVAFTSVASGFANKGRFREAFLIYRYMNEQNIKPDVVLCSALLKGYCQAHSMKEANALFNEMVVDAGLVPDIILYNILIKGFCGVGDLDSAFRFVDSMVKQGIVPNDITYKALIIGYEKKKVQHPAEAAMFKLQQIIQK